MTFAWLTLSATAVYTTGQQSTTQLVSVWFGKVWFGSDCKDLLCMTKAFSIKTQFYINLKISTPNYSWEFIIHSYTVAISEDVKTQNIVPL